jgi:hypothetical protein
MSSCARMRELAAGRIAALPVVTVLVVVACGCARWQPVPAIDVPFAVARRRE